jgi:tyrosinase
VLLLEFERELQAVDPSVTIPYWDWTVDRMPTSTLWQANFLGGNGTGSDDRVADGPFAGQNGRWRITIADEVGSPDFLRRNMGGQDTARNLPTSDLQQRVLTRTPYDTEPWDDMLRNENDPAAWGGFRIGLEIPLHNLVHRWVGGNMLDMSSPNDPVFWLHHCNCDRLWSLWQFQHPGTAGYLPGAAGPLGHNFNDTLIFQADGAIAPWDSTYQPAALLDHRTHGVRYDTDPPGAPPVAPPSLVAEPFAAGPPVPHRHRHELPMFALPAEIAALRDGM